MKVVIIGGIAAGMSAAAKFKRLCPNDEVIVYEKGDIVSFGACGLPYYVGGFFEDSNEMIARTPEKFRESGVDIFTKHEVLGIDFDSKTLKVKNIRDNEEFTDSYDKLMIATGARAIIPPIKNVNLENVLTLKSMEDGNRIKALLSNPELKKVTIIGAGFIGLEAVEAAKQKGKEVTVVQLQDRVLAEVFDKEITDLLEEEIRSHEVNLLLNETVLELGGDTKVNKVITNKGEFETDLVILATGVRPNTEFITDQRIEKLRNGAIVVDKFGRTSIEDVYAAGDCATINNYVSEKEAYVPLATGANKLGRIVGENLAGQNNCFQGSYEPFLMTYGDGVCDVEIDKLIEFHKSHGKLATLTAVKMAQDKGILDITKDQAVRAFREKNAADGAPINAGYMILEPLVFDMLEGGDTCVFEKTVLVKLAEMGELMSYVHTGFWQCMDNIREKSFLEKLLAEDKAPWKRWDRSVPDIPDYAK